MKTKVRRFTLICVVRISPAQTIQSLKKIFTPKLNFSKLLPEPLKRLCQGWCNNSFFERTVNQCFRKAGSSSSCCRPLSWKNRGKCKLVVVNQTGLFGHFKLYSDSILGLKTPPYVIGYNSNLKVYQMFTHPWQKQ